MSFPDELTAFRTYAKLYPDGDISNINAGEFHLYVN